MTMDDTTIDIHLSKFLDWLVDRRHCPKDWNERVMAIRAKIEKARLDLPDDRRINEILCSSFLDYFSTLKIVEILKETEKESKNMFGMYSSQRMKDWKTILANYEKNSIYLMDCAQILQRNVAFEIPELKKQMNKCQQIREESHTRHQELEKNIQEIEKQYSQLAQEMSIEGIDVEKELIDRIEHLPELCNELLGGNDQWIHSLKSAIEFYSEFVKYFHRSKNDQEENLSLCKYLVEHGNQSVYQWKSGGHQPIQLERPSFHYKSLLQHSEEDQTNLNLDLDENLDLDLQESIDGIEIKQSSEQSDHQELDLESGIDWSCIDTVPELLDPALTSNGTHPNSIPDALREAALNGSNLHQIDDGIARGNDALSLLENRSTYILFIHQLHRLQSFLKQRLNEHHVNQNILMTFIMQNAPKSIQNITENDLKKYLESIDRIFNAIKIRQLDRLFLMRDSMKYFHRLIQSFKQKKISIERNRFQQEQFQERASNALKEEQIIKEKLKLLIHYTKKLKEQVSEDLSVKKYPNRRINIMGEINTL